MPDRRFVAFDTETTGLRPDLDDRIVELGAVQFSPDGRELGRFSRLANPGRPIPLNARLVHGITDAMVSSARPTRDVVAGFLDLLTLLGGRDSVVLIAHNAAFDVSCLAYEMARSDLGVFDYDVIDTLVLSRAAFPELPNHKLDTVARHLALDTASAHRALADALRCGLIWRQVCCVNRDPAMPLLPLTSPVGPRKD